MTATDDPIRVFISYSHDSDAHRQRVLQLANQLRHDGLECIIDQYIPVPPEGWPRWMANQAEAADFILLIITATYAQRFGGKAPEGVGKGGDWEGAIITQALYDNKSLNTKFIPVLLDAEDEAHIPLILAGTNYYRVDTRANYETLYDRLTSQHPTPNARARRCPR